MSTFTCIKKYKYGSYNDKDLQCPKCTNSQNWNYFINENQFSIRLNKS